MDETGAQIEIWKKIVDVQQHFNDLELRIRNFTLIVTGAFLGLGGYAVRDGSFTIWHGHKISTSALIVAFSILPVAAFYLMDRLWYHRLLDGSVKAGIAAEGKLRDLGLRVDLGSEISKASPFKLFGKGPRVHSRHKMDGFYGLLALTIVLLALTLATGIRPPPGGSQTPAGAAAGMSTAPSDDGAASAICRAFVADLYARSQMSGSRARHPATGQEAVLVGGRWTVVPHC